MCGIAGFINFKNHQSLAETLSCLQRHRGPDAQNIWSDTLISLSHQRLSIIDLDSRSGPKNQSSVAIAAVQAHDLHQPGKQFFMLEIRHVPLHHHAVDQFQLAIALGEDGKLFESDRAHVCPGYEPSFFAGEPSSG